MPFDIAVLTGSVKAAVATTKSAIGAIDALKNVELKLQMVGLMEQLVNVQSIAIEAQVRIQELEEQAKLVGEMTFRDPYYWKADEEGGEDGPYCTRCFDVDRKAVRLRVANLLSRCPECKNQWTDNTQKDNQNESNRAQLESTGKVAAKWKKGSQR